ncbi:MAG: hypothetical protein J5J06_08150 [Phycisphaerae bacterium]|nr:hypothetical protein [Phycisphaerae bacterium]
MVAESQETMKRMFDSVAETARTTYEAGRRMQESWFDAVGSGLNGESQKKFSFNGEGFMKQWFPMVGRNLGIWLDATNEAFQANMNVHRRTCETIGKFGEKDFVEEQRQLADASATSFRSTMDAYTKAGQAVSENWTNWCRSATCCSGSGSE